MSRVPLPLKVIGVIHLMSALTYAVVALQFLAFGLTGGADGWIHFPWYECLLLALVLGALGAGLGAIGVGLFQGKAFARTAAILLACFGLLVNGALLWHGFWGHLAILIVLLLHKGTKAGYSSV